jgi:hypothetical protein
MADAVTNAIAKLDGRDPDKGGYPTLPYRLTKLYNERTDEVGPEHTPVRKEGGDQGPGKPWNTPSTLDEVTVLAEILTQVYVDPSGKKHTAFDMLVGLYKKQVLGL